MIALHLSFMNGAACIWAEAGEGAGKPRRKRTINPLAHPYDGGVTVLRDALQRLLPETSVTVRNTDLLFAWLPSTGVAPLSSSPILRDIPSDLDGAVIKPWLVTVRRLHEVEALQLLLSLGEETFGGTGMVPGESILWARDSYLPMLRMAAKGAFLPELRLTDAGAEARWLPSPDDDTARACASMARSMPAVCRCLNASNQTAPAEAPDKVFGEALATSLDAFIRMSDHAPTPATRRGRRAPETLHDAWLEALVSIDPEVRWTNSRELSAFAEQLHQWRRPVRIAESSPFRLCFRLSEPAKSVKGSAQPVWPVDYLLQLKSDPSLMSPVSELWKPKSRALREFDRRGNTLEFVLSALGQAAGLEPGIAESLRNKQPSGFDLDTVGAVEFLQSRAELLRTAGFPVILPAWWLGNGTSENVSIHVSVGGMKGANSGAFSLDSILSFDVEASLGGQELSRKELMALARLKVPLVQVRGQWMLIDRKRIDAALKYLAGGSTSKIKARDALRLALGADIPGLGFKAERVESTGWLEGLLRSLRRELETEAIAIPSGFTGALRPYQETGFSWLGFMRRWGFGACLADDMGLGKTVQTLALILSERERGEKQPVLLICPTSVLNNWRRESEKFTPGLRVHIHHGTGRMRQDAFVKIASESDLVVSSYGLLQRDVEILRGVAWAGMVLDEAQNIKNPDTRQARAARSVTAGYRLALTGTPVENHVGDLWSLMEFLNPGLLGTQSGFRSNYFIPIQLSRDAEVSRKLKSIAGPFILRREKSDKAIISDLPEKIEIKSYCTLTKEQATLYQAVLEELEASVDSSEGIERSGLVLALLTKLKQVCNHPAQLLGDGSELDGRSGKLARLKELLAEIREAGERALVFSQYAVMGGLLQRYLQEQFCEETLFLHGAVPRTKRDEMVDRFQNDARAPRVFILSLKAGGTGLNLTRANHVVHYDRWWNPAVENQATDRAFRIGQKRNVTVHKFIVSGTFEERIDDLIERKSGIAAEIVGSGEQWLSKLSNNELRNLVRLSADAIGE